MNHLIEEKDSPILWLTLNRPEASNAISLEMVELLVSALEKAESDDEVRVVVIKGAGKHFCSGGDIKAMKERSGMFAGDSEELRKRYQRGIQRIPLAMEKFQKPLIAQIQGACVGAGLDLACMCDIRIAGKKSQYAETFAKVGLVPGDGGSFLLQRVVGYAQAMEMFLTARFYRAEQAKAFGLIHKLVESDRPQDLEQEVRTWAHEIAQHSPVAISMTKMALKRGKTESLESQLEFLAALQGIAQRTAYHDQALDALSKKQGE